MSTASLFAQMNLSLQSMRRVLLVIAHPDDESMFFAPTLRNLSDQRINLTVLCLSKGPAVKQRSSATPQQSSRRRRRSRDRQREGTDGSLCHLQGSCIARQLPFTSQMPVDRFCLILSWFLTILSFKLSTRTL